MEKKYNSYWYNLNIRTLQETLEMRWRYLLTATAQGKRRGSKRKPNWQEMFSKFSELQLKSGNMKEVNAFQLNFNEFSNKLVAAFTTNDVEISVSFHCLTFFFLL